MNNGKMSKAEAGRLGGLNTYKKHGSEHMAKIGRRGFESTFARYRLAPYGTSDFALISRTTGKIVAFLSGRQVTE